MTVDALDPGPAGDFPHWPRNADGSTDRSRMPAGRRVSKTHRDALGNPVIYDVTPGRPDGTRDGPADQ